VASTSRRLLWTAGGCGLLLSGLACLGCGLGPIFGVLSLAGLDRAMAKEIPAQITRHSWKVNLPVQTMGWHEAEDWCADIPTGAEVISRSERLKDRDTERHRRKKEVRETYAEWCRYKTLGWHTAETLHSEGDGKTPRPPEAPNDGCAKEGCRRPGTATTLHYIHLQPRQGPTESVHCNLTEEPWNRSKVGDPYTFYRGRFTDQIWCI
jgi:hypothetical protein